MPFPAGFLCSGGLGGIRGAAFRATPGPQSVNVSAQCELGWPASPPFLQRFFVRQKFPKDPQLLCQLECGPFTLMEPGASGMGSHSSG